MQMKDMFALSFTSGVSSPNSLQLLAGKKNPQGNKIFKEVFGILFFLNLFILAMSHVGY